MMKKNIFSSALYIPDFLDVYPSVGQFLFYPYFVDFVVQVVEQRLPMPGLLALEIQCKHLAPFL